MKKNLLFVLCCIPLLGLTCPSSNTIIGLACSNNLDASAFGFRATVPADFACIPVQANPSLLVSVRYRQNSTGFIAAINLSGPGQNTGCGGDPTCTEQAQVTTANNVTFRMFRVTSANPAFITYLAITTLPNGNSLGISTSVLSSTDNAALLTTLNTILQSVLLV